MNRDMIKRIVRCATGCAAGLSLVCACSYTPLSNDGGGSRGGNPVVVGTIAGPDGVGAPNVRVSLIAEDYNPLTDTLQRTSSTDTTDSLGSFVINAPDSGWYNIEAVGILDGARLIRFHVNAVRSSVRVLPADTLRMPGVLLMPIPKGSDAITGYVYVPGTFIAARLAGGADTVVIDSVPSGTLPVLYYAQRGSTGKKAIRYDISVQSGDTTVIQNPEWSYCRRIVLNTSISGAGVKGNVYGFPVLIRLTADNFDFTRAEPKGEDIRFAKFRGPPLSHEIERWDPITGLAEVWVKADTMYGNDSTQSIAMYWGNPSAAGSSNSMAVFDTTAGFQGVWHLSDAVNDPVRDATANGYHGLSPDTARPQFAEGMVGMCRVFDGVNDYITMPYTANSKLNFPANGNYTVSAWVTVDSLDGASHLIVAKGYEQYFLRLTYFPSNSPLWEFSEFNQTNTWQACTTAATGRKWTLLTGVRQGSKQLLYCNGELVDDTPNGYLSASLSRNTSYDLSVGKFLELIDLPNNSEGYCFFKGSIDEVRIFSAAQSPDWVRLCYMNQRADDRLVVFK